ncbi:putative leucine-rich repeat receptor-like serine/threonine-protein kinase At3g53590 [Quercus lobata]|uniref:putative leucine-rich repeat receptor-like serine/threonine-protein kinase At3g53590 n=1 Tax=Quercus lobata TaxID=97700 RepID=UPI0012448B02|nr:putative leucine-rich repeat receptor-like serine/threonine-protein kinase At3g53590 [Quercus lobata]
MAIRQFLEVASVSAPPILSILVVALFCYLCKRKLFPILKQRYKKKGSLKFENILLRRFQLVELEEATNNFSQDCLPGSGAFGNVYKGDFDVEGTLAIKRPLADSYQSVEEFRNGPKGAKLLVYEYVPNGSMLEYITVKRGRSLTWRQRINITIGAAKGIPHLHEGFQPSIIHRDIKPSNILVGDEFKAKVSDFGLVKMGPTEDKTHVSSQIKGTPGYLDPAYCMSLHLTPFSDVYSFGVILLQLVTARPAIYSNGRLSNYHVVEWARPSLEKGSVEEILDVNLLSEPCNMEIMLKMAQLGLRCSVKVPKQRPTMNQVWQELEGEALHSVDNFLSKQPSSAALISSGSNAPCESMDNDYSQSFVSLNGVGFQRFHVEMESYSFRSTSLRCLEENSIIVDFDKKNLKGNT